MDALADAARGPLLAEIAAAFDGVSREGGVSLHELGALDACGGYIDRQVARARDTVSRWQDVPRDDLADVYTHTFLDPIGWRYYQPAYMTWWLTGGEHDDANGTSSFF